MTDARTPTPLRTLVVLQWQQRTWRRCIQLLLAPFPGLGIRVSVHEMIRVNSVIIGDAGYDVTCICTFEGDSDGYTDETMQHFGFEPGDYP